MPTVSSSCYDSLRADGPATLAELHARLAAAGVTTAKRADLLERHVDQHPRTVRLPDGRWDALPRVLAGLTLTVRPRSLLRGLLWTHRDAEPLDALLADGPLPLAGGGEVRRARTRLPSLEGPAGWLPHALPAGLVALRWDGERVHVFAPERVPDLASPQARRAHDLLHDHAPAPTAFGDGDRPAGLTATLVSARQEAPDLLTSPLPPLSELLPQRVTQHASHAAVAGPGVELRLTVSVRTADELHRRADAAGEPVEETAEGLLVAAVDRVLPAWASPDRRQVWEAWRDEPRVFDLW